MAKFELLLLAMLAACVFAFPSPARIVRTADPDPHRHQTHHHSHGGYFETNRGHGGYDGYNHDRHYNHQRPYQPAPFNHNRGGNSQASAVAGAFGSSYGSAAFAAANSQSGGQFF